MKNIRGEGDIVRYLNGGSAVVAGEVVDLGHRIGVAIADIAANEEGDIRITGEFELAKKSADTFTKFGTVYWDDTNNELTTTSTSNTKAGFCVAAAASSVVLATIVLDPSFT